MRQSLIALALLGVISLNASGQSQPPSDGPRFEVASVKVNASGDRGSFSNGTPGRFVASNLSAVALILNAYDVRDYQVLNAPSWTRTERFDVNATWPGQANEPKGRVPLRLQNLLADRFGLKAHTESRELPVYELVRSRSDGRLGEKLKPSSSDDGGSRVTGRGPSGFRMQRAEMTLLAAQLGSVVGRPVVDRTGLHGRFDLELSWMSDQPGGTATDANGPSIFTALQEQLGLRLQPARGPVDVLVIDRIERPTPD